MVQGHSCRLVITHQTPQSWGIGEGVAIQLSGWGACHGAEVPPERTEQQVAWGEMQISVARRFAKASDPASDCRAILKASNSQTQIGFLKISFFFSLELSAPENSEHNGAF